MGVFAVILWKVQTIGFTTNNTELLAPFSLLIGLKRSRNYSAFELLPEKVPFKDCVSQSSALCWTYELQFL